MKPCPYCAEEIQDKAIKCRYCGEDIRTPPPPPRPPASPPPTPRQAPATQPATTKSPRAGGRSRLTLWTIGLLLSGIACLVALALEGYNGPGNLGKALRKVPGEMRLETLFEVRWTSLRGEMFLYPVDDIFETSGNIGHTVRRATSTSFFISAEERAAVEAMAEGDKTAAETTVAVTHALWGRLRLVSWVQLLVGVLAVVTALLVFMRLRGPSKVLLIGIGLLRFLWGALLVWAAVSWIRVEIGGTWNPLKWIDGFTSMIATLGAPLGFLAFLVTGSVVDAIEDRL